jgi:acyl carrier protein
MTDAVSQKIVSLIAEHAMTEPEKVTLDATPDSLGLDSLAMVELVFAIEEAFDISAPFNANDPTGADFDVSNVGKIIEAVKRLIAEQA